MLIEWGSKSWRSCSVSVVIGLTSCDTQRLWWALPPKMWMLDLARVQAAKCKHWRPCEKLKSVDIVMLPIHTV